MPDISKSLEERVTELERSRDETVAHATSQVVSIATLHAMLRLTARAIGIPDDTYQEALVEAIRAARVLVHDELSKAVAARKNVNRSEVIN